MGIYLSDNKCKGCALMNKYAIIKKLAKELNLTVMENEPLSKYTTFKIGGNCALLIKLNSILSFQKIIECCNEENTEYLIIGNGSNLLINDCFIDKVILLVGSDFSEIYLKNDDIIVCQSGTHLSSLCKFALENSLSGLEFAYGIPATVGGAVYMNAGAYGGEISQVFCSCEALDLNGKLNTFTSKEAGFSYRHSRFQDNSNVILSVSFKLEKSYKDDINSLMIKNITARKSKQPLEFPSAGSMFKRPEGHYAAQLIDECGLKGLSVGDAQVSEKHAGFVVNKGHASFSDIIELVEKIKSEVKNKTGIVLECEPKIIWK